MRIGEIASIAEYRTDEQFQNCQFLEPNFNFPNWKKSRNFFIFQFGQLQKLQILKNRKIFNSKNSKNLQFDEFKNKFIPKILKISIWKIRKMSNLKNSKSFQFGKFEF